MNKFFKKVLLWVKRYQNLIVLGSLPVQIIVVQILALEPQWIETYYTQFFYKYLSQLLRFVFGQVAMPLGQILFYSLVAGLLVAVFKQMRRIILRQINGRQFVRTSFIGVFTFLSIFYFLFTGMWALNYHRRPIEEIVGIQEDSVSTKELEMLCFRLIQLTNQSRQQVTLNQQEPARFALTNQHLFANAPVGFNVAAKSFPELAYTYPAIKAVYAPQIMSFFGVSGIYFPFTGEANVNMHPPPYLLPNTICHEMAHQIGFASEDEANLVAYIACRLNPDPAFQYSGNYMAMKYAMNRLRKVKPQAHRRLERLYSKGVKQDLADNRTYWERFENPIEVFSDYFYDLFLKANDQRDGIKSYSKVVELLMGEFRKNNLDYPASDQGK